ncbi:MAG: hypothetical protein C6Y20_16270 [Tagaea sp. CACIAM 22H2]|nr:hypothetical protein [Tagaea sp. CACIAM 22H2]
MDGSFLSGAVANHEFEIERLNGALGALAAQGLMDQFGRAHADLVTRDAHAGEGGNELPREIEIVVTRDRQGSRHIDAAPLAFEQRAGRDDVGRAEQRARALWQSENFVDYLAAGRHRHLGLDLALGRQAHTRIAYRAAEAEMAVAHAIVIDR